MTLTIAHGPLSPRPPEHVNYRIEGPAHRLLFEDFPRRVRASFEGETVVDTRNGKLLHESALLPQLYVPVGDVRSDLLEATNLSTHCPFKGDASYWSVRVGHRVAADAVWAYPEPLPEAAWLSDHMAIYWDKMDVWFDEDEEIKGHLRDPYHRVDVRNSSRHVRVFAGGELIAETSQPKLLSETGLANRYYIPPGDIRPELLKPSDTRTICPYKGEASYWSLTVNGDHIKDAGWSYPAPLENALKAGDHICFSHDRISLEIDGDRVTS